jgi:hypothetical protein
MQYTDLELLAQELEVVRAEGKTLLKFTLTAVAGPGPIKCEVDLRTVRTLRIAALDDEATWKEAAALGAALSSALLPTEIFNVVNNRIDVARASKEGLRIRLILSGSELNNLPWEFMVMNRGGGEVKLSDFLCLNPNVSLVRHPATTLPAWRLAATSPVQVMIAAVSPAKEPALNVSKEVALIQKALKPNPHVSVSTLENAQINGLPDKTNPAHIFHFAGHGKFEKQQSAKPGAYEGTGSLVLENEDGEPDVLDADTLAVRLSNAGVRLAVLGACQSAERDDVNVWGSVAESLLKAELGAVVGMKFKVRDDSATAFAEKFYNALAIGLSVDEAVTAGRVAVASLKDAKGWANPALYLRAPDGVIFEKIAADPKLQAERQQATVTIDQEIGDLYGEALGFDFDTISAGSSTKVKQNVDNVKPGGKLIGGKARQVGGSVHVDQTIDCAEGDITGLSVGGDDDDDD